MKVNIWVAVIVLLIGLWDLYTAYNRYQKKKMTKKDVKDNLVKGTIGALTTLPSSGKAYQNSVKAFKKAVRNLDQKVNGTSIHKDDK